MCKCRIARIWKWFGNQNNHNASMLILVLVGLVFASPYISSQISNTSTQKVEDSSGTIQTIGQVGNNTITNVSIRLVEPMETGRDVHQLPDNVFGFVTPNSLRYEVWSPGHLPLSSDSDDGRRYEIRKNNGEIHVVGYVGPEKYAELGSEIIDQISMTILPSEWEDIKLLVLVPLESISIASTRKIDIPELGQLEVLDIKAGGIGGCSIGSCSVGG